MMKSIFAALNDAALIQGLRQHKWEGDAFRVVGAADNARDAMDGLFSCAADILLIDMQLSGRDGIELICGLEKRPDTVVLCSAFFNDDTAKLAAEADIDDFIMLPTDADEIELRLLRMTNPDAAEELGRKRFHAMLREGAEKMLDELGIRSELKGCRYLSAAIALFAAGGGKLKNSIYPRVAAMFDTSANNVERCIRHSIETAWLKGKMSKQHEYFGYTVQERRGKPTNAEFIAMLSDRLKNGCNTDMLF